MRWDFKGTLWSLSGVLPLSAELSLQGYPHTMHTEVERRREDSEKRERREGDWHKTCIS